jgi:hypothetical protein
MDAAEYGHPASLANEAIAEAVARYLHEAVLEACIEGLVARRPI